MRRVLRGHDKPYAIFKAFGGKPDGSFEESEQYVLDNIAKVAQGQREFGCHFDFYSVNFWVDYNGDLKQFDPLRFPHGFQNIRGELARLGTPGPVDRQFLGDLVDRRQSGGAKHDELGTGKDVSRLPFNRRSLCRATEPIKSMYTEAFRHHIRENSARLLKFDNFATLCMNPSHEHLPASTRPSRSRNAAMEFLRALDAECPDVFLMLYWGYGSPWWLLLWRYAVRVGHRRRGGQSERVAGDFGPQHGRAPGRSSPMACDSGPRHPAVGQGFAGRVAFRLAVEQSDRQGPLARRAW